MSYIFFSYKCSVCLYRLFFPNFFLKLSETAVTIKKKQKKTPFLPTPDYSLQANRGQPEQNLLVFVHTLSPLTRLAELQILNDIKDKNPLHFSRVQLEHQRYRECIYATMCKVINKQRARQCAAFDTALPSKSPSQAGSLVRESSVELSGSSQRVARRRVIYLFRRVLRVEELRGSTGTACSAVVRRLASSGNS